MYSISKDDVWRQMESAKFFIYEIKQFLDTQTGKSPL